MRIMIIFSSLAMFYTSFFCLGMNQKLNPFQKQLNNQNANNNNQSFAVKQNLTLGQQLSVKGVGDSLHMVNDLMKLSPKDEFSIFEFQKENYNNIITSLDTLTYFLETVLANNLCIDIAPATYMAFGKIAYIYPISIALDFLHPPLLIACKKHYLSKSAPPHSFGESFTCIEGQETVPALEKYLIKVDKVSTKCLESIKKPQENKNISFFLSQFDKLSKILRILTVPNCYE